MANPVIKSNRQLIRLWFEFYKLCLDDPDLQANLEQSKAYYSLWGDVKVVTFDDWWKGHADLFGGTRVEEVKRISNHPNVINVSIPLNQPISQSIQELKALIAGRQQQRLRELKLDTKGMKAKAPSFGRYEMTKGVEVRGKTLYEILVIYSTWLDLGRPAINTEFCSEVVSRLRNRPRSKWILYILQIEPQPDKKGNLRYGEDQLRQVRRYLKKGAKVCAAVSLGEFPGKNILT